MTAAKLATRLKQLRDALKREADAKKQADATAKKDVAAAKLDGPQGLQGLQGLQAAHAAQAAQAARVAQVVPAPPDIRPKETNHAAFIAVYWYGKVRVRPRRSALVSRINDNMYAGQPPALGCLGLSPSLGPRP